MSDNESGRAASAGQRGAADGPGEGGGPRRSPAPVVTSADLERWQALADAATPGPWTHDPAADEADVIQDRPDMADIGGGPIVAECGGRQPMWTAHHNDAAFIAAARVAVPRLVARVRELEVERLSLLGAGTVSIATIAAERDAARERVRELTEEVEQLRAESDDCVSAVERQMPLVDALPTAVHELVNTIRDQETHMEEARERVRLLEVDQADWRKGVALIASALGEKDPNPNLCCVRISRVALEQRSALEKQAESVRLLEGLLRECCDGQGCECVPNGPGEIGDAVCAWCRAREALAP
jgi:hypothetical protein